MSFHTTHKKGFGWKPDVPDKRDKIYRVRALQLPPAVDLRSECPPVRDQGQLGSCTAFASTGAFEFALLKEKKHDFEPSELFVYYQERKIEGTTDYDSGAFIRDGFKSLAANGVCPEALWPYDISQFTIPPNQKAVKAAKKEKALTYARVVQDLQSMKTCLSQGYPFAIGFTVYDSFMTDQVAQTGIVPMPDLNTESVQGGHAVLVVGYNDDQQHWIVRNSWSDQWGDKGYFYMPYQYFTDNSLSDDLWMVSLTM